MNTTIQNPVAAVASAMNPVTAKDIAEKLGMSLSTVKQYMSPGYRWSGKGVQLVRKTAEEMGYDPKAALSYGGSIWRGKSRKTGAYHNLSDAPDHIDGPVTLKRIAEIAGVSVPTVQREIKKQAGPIWELALKYGYENFRDPAVIERKAKEKAERKAQEYYKNTPFHSVEERTKYMLYLRSQGYGTFDIARMAGTTPKTVRYHIGSEPVELANQNRAMGQHIRAQKNAARKQYVINKPIREYNKRVEQHNQMKAELNKLQTELLTEKPAIVQAAQMKINFPLVDLHTVQPTALQ